MKRILLPLFLLTASLATAAPNTVPARDVTLEAMDDNASVTLTTNNLQCLADWIDRNWVTNSASVEAFVERYAGGYVYYVNDAIADTSNRMLVATSALATVNVAITNLQIQGELAVQGIGDAVAAAQVILDGASNVVVGVSAATIPLTNALTIASNAVSSAVSSGITITNRQDLVLMSLAVVSNQLISATGAVAAVAGQTDNIVAQLSNWVGTNIVTILPQFTGYYYASLAGSNTAFFDTASGIAQASGVSASNETSDTGAFGFMSPGTNLCGVFGTFDSVIPQGITNCTEIRFPCRMSQDTNEPPVVRVMDGVSSFVWTNLAGLNAYSTHTQAVPPAVTAWLRQNTRVQWRIYSTNSSLTNGVPAYTLFQTPTLYQATP